MKKILILSILIISVQAYAQTYNIEYFKKNADGSYPTVVDEFVCFCLEDSSTSENGIIFCLDATSDQWDAKIDKYYNSLIKTLDKKYADQLVLDQIAWTKYKEEQLKMASMLFVDRQAENGKSVQLINYHKTKVMINRQRAIYLEYYFNNN
jgi:uncharacterized protein YecT (DUF1311 family)